MTDVVAIFKKNGPPSEKRKWLPKRWPNWCVFVCTLVY